MARERFARDLPGAVEQVDHAGREPGLFDQGGQVQDAERGLLGGFEHDGVAACERGAEFPCRHRERVVPGDDLRADAEGLADCVGEFGRAGVDDLAVQLVGVTGVVAEGGRDFGDVFREGDGVGFTIVPCFDGGEGFGVFVNCGTRGGGG